MFEAHPMGTINITTDSTGFQEKNKLFIQIIETMLHPVVSQHPLDLFDSNLSINSLIHAAEDANFMQENQLSVEQEVRHKMGFIEIWSQIIESIFQFTAIARIRRKNVTLNRIKCLPNY